LVFAGLLGVFEVQRAQMGRRLDIEPLTLDEVRSFNASGKPSSGDRSGGR
jgi:hypothetical protein